MLTQHPIQEFEAWATCPNCLKHDLHPMSPAPEPMTDEIYKYAIIAETTRENNSITEIYTWGETTPARTVTGYIAKRVKMNKNTCDTIRTCEHCGTQWGEK